MRRNTLLLTFALLGAGTGRTAAAQDAGAPDPDAGEEDPWAVPADKGVVRRRRMA
jgi:hypothetical protein